MVKSQRCTPEPRPPPSAGSVPLAKRWQQPGPWRWSCSLPGSCFVSCLLTLPDPQGVFEGRGVAGPDSLPHATHHPSSGL